MLRQLLAASRPLISRLRPAVSPLSRLYPTSFDVAAPGMNVPQLARGMKVRSSVKRMCPGCSVVIRKGKVYVVCARNPKHKQRQG